ncbi:MAG: flagellar biosynthesis protein FlhF [Chitinispirillales bacterium]|jgi:flagellar biosynthesis protein FlhF|nr:flagellar biosynthesis protein FlhF [Chitinispirillales bacterium]
MRIKKYVAKSTREAYEQIKAELGEDAIILKHEKVPKMFGGTEYEVTAAIDENAPAQKKTEFPPLRVSGADAGAGAGTGIDASTGVDSGLYGPPSRRTAPQFDTPPPKPEMPEPAVPDIRPYFPQKQPPYANQDRGDSVDAGQYQRQRTVASAKQPHPSRQDYDEISEIKADIQELKELVKTILAGAAKPGAGGMIGPGSPIPAPEYGSAGGWNAFVKRLTDSEVKPEIAKKLVNSIRGGGQVTDAELEKKLIDALSDQFPTSGPLKLKKGAPLTIAFVGPTGSGKTTTLAKLAAHCCFNKSKKISIITADTYRIAAIEQIRMFADIVSVGLQVVFSPDEIPDALAACEGSDVVFVDTAGRSQRNKEHMEELRLLVDVLRPDETHLVLSATTKDSDLLDMVHNYRNVRVNRLLFTKLDETARLGNIFNVVSELGIPVSYFTAGQSVPDDIELAQAGKFVKKLMEGRTL